MRTSFSAYTNESRDEGFRFRRNAEEQASSDWFVLTGLVTRKESERAAMEVVNAVRSELKLRSRDHIH